jgi:hypothetical protein
MALNLSQGERTEMVALWFDRIVDGYPAETSRFLREQSDPFANPVGAGLREELAPILDSILDDGDPAEIEPSLDRVIRVRALQDMSPSAAVSFVLLLKEIFDEVVEQPRDGAKRIFDSRVDGMLLTAFNVFNHCREQVFDIRVKEIRNRSLKVMERLNSWREARVGGPGSNA